MLIHHSGTASSSHSHLFSSSTFIVHHEGTEQMNNVFFVNKQRLQTNKYMNSTISSVFPVDFTYTSSVENTHPLDEIKLQYGK